MRRGTSLHADQARRQSFEKRNHLAAPQLLSHNNLLLGVDPVDLKHVLGDIQTDRGNLHLDGSPHVIRHNNHSMAPRCRERAPSTTSIALLRHFEARRASPIHGAHAPTEPTDGAIKRLRPTRTAWHAVASRPCPS
jgi:hypothetical protein